MKHYTPYLFSSLLVLFSSCVKESISEGESKLGGNSELTIKTRSGNTDNATSSAAISYPVQIYVFDAAEGHCVTTAPIDESNPSLSLKLVEGRYDVCAIAGATADNYNLPSATDALKTTAITLKEGKQHTALMGAANSVTLADGENNTLTLSLKHKTMLLQSVTINNVPTSVTAVAVDIAPLYAGLCLNGTYSSETTHQQVTLTRQDGTRTWKNTDATHLLQAGEGSTITVKMTNVDGDGQVKSYSYTCENTLEANYKLTIEGTYTEKVGVQLSGSITAEEWAGERNVTFYFNEDGSTATGDNNQGDNNQGGNGQNDDNNPADVINEKAPTAGANYNGACVVQRTENANGTVTVLLLAPKDEINLSFDATDQVSVKAAIDAAIPNIAVSGISGWRLPTYDEINYIVENCSKLKETLQSISGGQTIISDLSYFFLDETDNTVKLYEKKNKKDVNAYGRLRAFTTLVFSQP